MPSVIVDVPPLDSSMSPSSSGPSSVPTATSTIPYNGTRTATTTSSGIVVVETPCTDPAGYIWAHYTKDYTNADDPNYDASSDFQTEEPDVTGVTNKVTLRTETDDNSIYGKEADTSSFALNIKTYLHAQESGTYTFQLGNEDDELRIWVGDGAYTGYNDNNRDANVYRSNGENGSGNYTVDLNEGQYYPVRLLFFNKNGQSTLSLNAISPNGTIIDGNDGSGFVQYGCDPRENAPRFKDFGNEA